MQTGMQQHVGVECEHAFLFSSTVQYHTSMNVKNALAQFLVYSKDPRVIKEITDNASTVVPKVVTATAKLIDDNIDDVQKSFVQVGRQLALPTGFILLSFAVMVCSNLAAAFASIHAARMTAKRSPTRSELDSAHKAATAAWKSILITGFVATIAIVLASLKILAIGKGFIHSQVARYEKTISGYVNTISSSIQLPVDVRH